MLKIEYATYYGFAEAVHGMRNPMNSWECSDSKFNYNLRDVVIGKADRTLMQTLAQAGPCHAKYRRFIVVYADIVAPLYWWKEFDTYKVGTAANSCSTMHKIADKEFTWNDFSTEHLIRVRDSHLGDTVPTLCMDSTILALNELRQKYITTHNKAYWYSMIQLLPSSYNQRRTVMLNYEVLSNIYHQRKGHKLDEWRDFCRWIENMPYAELITLEGGAADESSNTP